MRGPVGLHGHKPRRPALVTDLEQDTLAHQVRVAVGAVTRGVARRSHGLLACC